MTETPESAPQQIEPHDEDADLLAGEPVAPEHTLDIASFEEEDDESEEVDAPWAETEIGEGDSQ